jgi:hypothetical protein
MDTTIFIKQLEEIVFEYTEFKNKSEYDDCSDVITDTKAQELITRILASIERTVGKQSIYFGQAQNILLIKSYDNFHLMKLIGIANSVIFDLKAGYTTTFEELIHSDIFSDFLEMAGYLLSSGYKDASAVIAGSTLESHIKLLCDKFNIDLLNDKGRPKVTNLLNTELVKATAYNKLEQKNITAWLGLRNDAAHGNYDEYDKKQVENLINGIKDFIIRNQA